MDMNMKGTVRRDQYHRGTSLAVLSVYALASFGLMLTPAVHNLAAVFHDVPYGVVSMLVTLPNLTGFIMAVALATPLAARIHYKHILTFGLTCFVVGGLFPFFTSSFTLTILARGVFGIGYGIVFGQTNRVSIELYEGERLERILSLGAICTNGFAMISIVAGGIISDINVHMIWLTHMVALIPLALVLLYLPGPEHGKSGTAVTERAEPEKRAPEAVEKSRIPMYAYILCIGYGLAYMVAKCVMLTLSSIMIEEHIGTAALAGLLIAFNRGGGMVGGAVFTFVYHRFRAYTIPVCLLVETLMVAICWKSSSVIMLGVAIVMLGVVQYVIQLTLLADFSEEIPAVSGRVASLVVAMVSIGGFLPSVFLSALTNVTGENDFRFAIFLLVFLAAGLTAAWMVRALRSARK